MGDYCTLELKPQVTNTKKGGKNRRGSTRKDEASDLLGSLAPVQGGGGSFGDLVCTRDGTVLTMNDVKPKERQSRTLLPGITFQTEEEQGEAQEDDAPEPPNGLEAAVDESATYKGGPPTHRIAYRNILIDRTLRGMGVTESEPAPPGVLLQVEARTRRRLDLYYKPAHVCANCARWYERLSRQRAAELDAYNSPLEPILKPNFLNNVGNFL